MRTNPYLAAVPARLAPISRARESEVPADRPKRQAARAGATRGTRLTPGDGAPETRGRAGSELQEAPLEGARGKEILRP